MLQKILICEDNPRLLADYQLLLTDSTEFLIAGAVTRGREAIDLLQQITIQLLVVDLGLPDISGVEVIRAMKRYQPQCEALVVTVFGDEDTVLQAIEAGAAGYVIKDELDSQLLKSIRDITQGGSPISPSIARLLLQRLPNRASPLAMSVPAATLQGDASQSLPFAWSDREGEVLMLISKGYSLHEVGDMLHLSVNTIKTHVRRIYGKLTVNSRSEAIYEARALGLLDRPLGGSSGDRS
jgi:DNA-binding NarL/FixJ family response regulator